MNVAVPFNYSTRGSCAIPDQKKNGRLF